MLIAEQVVVEHLQHPDGESDIPSKRPTSPDSTAETSNGIISRYVYAAFYCVPARLNEGVNLHVSDHQMTFHQLPLSVSSCFQLCVLFHRK